MTDRLTNQHKDVTVHMEIALPIEAKQCAVMQVITADRASILGDTLFVCKNCVI